MSDRGTARGRAGAATPENKVREAYIQDLERILNALLSPKATESRTPVTRVRAQLMADRAFRAYSSGMKELGKEPTRSERRALVTDYLTMPGWA